MGKDEEGVLYPQLAKGGTSSQATGRAILAAVTLPY
jgi:hypothetical protein